MNNFPPESEKITVIANTGHRIKQERSPELEELITYLVNYLKPQVLSDLQEQVLRGAWQGKTYAKISQETFNDPDYLKGIGANIWKILSEAWSEEVTKRNIKLVTKCNYQKLLEINQKSQQEAIKIPKITNYASITEKSGKETVTNPYRDWGEAVDVSLFYGRTQELATLEKWLISDHVRSIAVFGRGGIGKTSLATKLARQVAPEFEIVLWKSLRNAPEFKDFLAEMIVAFCDRTSLYISDNIEGQINNLMNCLRNKRCLLVLDRLDNILASGKLGGQYLDAYQGYGQLLRRIQDEPHRSSVLITSREKPTGLSLREAKKSLVRSLVLKGLSSDAALNILYDRGLISSEATLKELSDRCEGNPLILKMATATIKALFTGDVHHFISHHTLLYGNIWQLIDREFQRLSNLEKQIMYYLALENSHVNLTKLSKNIQAKASYGQIIEALESLQGRSLIEVTETRFILQPLILDYLKMKLLQEDKE